MHINLAVNKHFRLWICETLRF